MVNLPIGVVLIKEVPEQWDVVEDVLKDWKLNIEKFENCKAVLLKYFRTFGWSDFIAIVWSSNAECIKDWVIKFREECQEKTKEKKVPLTTTIICIESEVEQNDKKDEVKRNVELNIELECLKEVISSKLDESSITKLEVCKLRKYIDREIEELEKLRSELEKKIKINN